jgi:hypothetical protein
LVPSCPASGSPYPPAGQSARSSYADHINRKSGNPGCQIRPRKVGIHGKEDFIRKADLAAFLGFIRKNRFFPARHADSKDGNLQGSSLVPRKYLGKKLERIMRTIAGLSFVLAAWAMAQQPSFGQYGNPNGYRPDGWMLPQPPQPFMRYAPQQYGYPNGPAMTPGIPYSAANYPALQPNAMNMVVPPAVTPATPANVPAALPVIPGTQTVVVGNSGDDSSKATADTAKAAPAYSDGQGDHCWGEDSGCFAAHMHNDWDEPCYSQHHHYVFGEFLFLRPADGADVVFARTADGCGTTAVPRGPLGSLEPDFAPGFRAGGGFALTCASSIDLSFTWFDVTTHAGLFATGDLVVQSALTLPQTLNCTSNSQSAFATEHIGFRFGDVAYRHLLCGDCCHYAINFFAGARYAHLDESLESTFNIIGTTVVDSKITFDGAGPRIGLDGSVVCKHGFLLYLTPSASFLAGHFGASFMQNNVFAGNQGSVDFRDERIVPILELEAGVGWISPCGHVRLTAGYTIAAWFNTLTTADFINAVQNNNFTTNGDNLRDVLTFDGLVARAEIRF